MLTNSTKFAQGLLHHVYNDGDRSEEYFEMVKTIDELYVSFDNFQEDWMLDEYEDLKDNIEKQKKIYEWFKYYIQYLFGIGNYYVDFKALRRPIGRTPKYKTMIAANMNGICDSSGLSVARTIDNGFKFIDLNDDMIKNDRDLEFFIETLKSSYHGIDEEIILLNLQNPHYNGYLDLLRKDDDTPHLKFDAVSDIRTFLQKRWNFR